MCFKLHFAVNNQYSLSVLEQYNGDNVKALPLLLIFDEF